MGAPVSPRWERRGWQTGVPCRPVGAVGLQDSGEGGAWGSRGAAPERGSPGGGGRGGSPADHGGVLLHGRLQQPLQDRPFAHRDGSGGCRTGTLPGPGPPPSPAPPGPLPALSAAAPSPPSPSARGEPSAAPSPARPRGAAGARSTAPGPGCRRGGGERVRGRAGRWGHREQRGDAPRARALCWGHWGDRGLRGHRCRVPGRRRDALRSSWEASVCRVVSCRVVSCRDPPPPTPPPQNHSGRPAPTALRRPNPAPFASSAAPRSGCGAGTRRGGGGAWGRPPSNRPPLNRH